MENENIIIVDDHDRCIGCMDKMTVHSQGILHRAFSILLFDGSGNMLIQQRSSAKYHSPLLWANACCSHQREGETLEESAYRRLFEELRIAGADLKESFVFQYRCAMENSLIENEVDHVFVGRCLNSEVPFNRDEIEQVAFVNLDALRENIQGSAVYAYWFKRIIEKMNELGNSLFL